MRSCECVFKIKLSFYKGGVNMQEVARSLILFDVCPSLRVRIEGLKRLVARMETGLGINGTEILTKLHETETMLSEAERTSERSPRYGRIIEHIETLLDRLDERCVWTSVRTIFSRIEENADLFLSEAGRRWWLTDIKPLVASLVAEGDSKGAINILQQTEQALKAQNPRRQESLLESVRAAGTKPVGGWIVTSHEQ